MSFIVNSELKKVVVIIMTIVRPTVIWLVVIMKRKLGKDYITSWDKLDSKQVVWEIILWICE